MLDVALGFLAEAGLDLVKRAIHGGGEKVVKNIEDVTGISMKGRKEPFSTDERDVLLKFQEQNRVKLEEIALRVLEEQNRHAEEIRDDVFEDRQHARDMAARVGIQMQKHVISRVFDDRLTTPVILLANVATLIAAKLLKLDESVVLVAGNLCGMVLKQRMDERKSVIEFLCGAGLRINDSK